MNVMLMTGDRAQWLGQVADEFMRTRAWPRSLPPAVLGLRATTWPDGSESPSEVRFAARFAGGDTIVAARLVPPGWFE